MSRQPRLHRSAITLADLIARRAAQRPDAVAIDDVVSRTYTWGELDGMVRDRAAVLHASGVARGEPVVTALPPGPDAIAHWAAIASLGAVDTPINPAYTGVWLENVLGSVGARVAVVTGDVWPDWAAVLSRIPIEHVIDIDGPTEPSLDGVRVRALADALADARHPQQPYPASDDDIACVIHTSGTTGVSKGVLLSWAAFWFRTDQPNAPRRPTSDTVWYTPAGSFHISARRPWFDVARRGGRVCTRPSFKTDEWLRDVRQHGCTATSLVGSMARFLLETPPRADDADNALDEVAMVPVVPNVDAFKARFGVTVITGFAQTEIPPVTVTLDPEGVSDATAASCGVANPSMTFRLVDEAGADVPDGVPGELVVRGDARTLNSGYLNALTPQLRHGMTGGSGPATSSGATSTAATTSSTAGRTPFDGEGRTSPPSRSSKFSAITRRWPSALSWVSRRSGGKRK